MKNTVKVRTYNRGMVTFNIGSEYTAIGTCGTAKDFRVKGILIIDNSHNSSELVLVSKSMGIISINEKTLYEI